MTQIQANGNGNPAEVPLNRSAEVKDVSTEQFRPVVPNVIIVSYLTTDMHDSCLMPFKSS